MDVKMMDFIQLLITELFCSKMGNFFLKFKKTLEIKEQGPIIVFCSFIFLLTVSQNLKNSVSLTHPVIYDNKDEQKRSKALFDRQTDQIIIE